MAWENRGRCGPYYTRSRKVNGRVVREYVGGGIVGQLAAALDAEERKERLVKREAERRELAKLDEAEQMLGDCCTAIEMLTRATLYANGYHRHKNGEWRRRRGQGKSGGNNRHH